MGTYELPVVEVDERLAAEWWRHARWEDPTDIDGGWVMRTDDALVVGVWVTDRNVELQELGVGVYPVAKYQVPVPLDSGTEHVDQPGHRVAAIGDRGSNLAERRVSEPQLERDHACLTDDRVPGHPGSHDGIDRDSFRADQAEPGSPLVAHAHGPMVGAG